MIFILNFNSIKNDNKKVMHMNILWSTYYLNVLWDEIKILIKHFYGSHISKIVDFTVICMSWS